MQVLQVCPFGNRFFGLRFLSFCHLMNRSFRLRLVAFEIAQRLCVSSSLVGRFLESVLVCILCILFFFFHLLHFFRDVGNKRVDQANDLITILLLLMVSCGLLRRLCLHVHLREKWCSALFEEHRETRLSFRAHDVSNMATFTSRMAKLGCRFCKRFLLQQRFLFGVVKLAEPSSRNTQDVLRRIVCCQILDEVLVFFFSLFRCLCHLLVKCYDAFFLGFDVGKHRFHLLLFVFYSLL
mmetsp:Transcript_76118/g.120194  ORF Transcript_76118/g.120194 Transcript_76118/m.120194 type:complete len:238 (-) Transcript_76118:1485-2198(-)